MVIMWLYRVIDGYMVIDGVYVGYSFIACYSAFLQNCFPPY